jgi:outer membrane protein assembly factor BamB
MREDAPMSIDGGLHAPASSVPPPPPPPPSPPASTPPASTPPASTPPEPAAAAQPRALADYLARMRRQRKIYLAALAMLAVLIVVVVQVVMRTGEISHATLLPAKSAVASPTADTPSTTLTRAWSTTDAMASGVPFSGGTVITYNQHTVTGRNYATGEAVWTYTRTDLSTCTVFQERDLAIAIFADRDGYCDEMSTFDAGTGTRGWFRTLDSNGNNQTSRPVITGSDTTIMITTPKFIQAIDPGGGIERWTFIQPTGCTTTTAVLGEDGVLIGQKCADGDHLVLRDATLNDDDDHKNKTTKWRLDKTNMVPASADELISAIDPKTGELVSYAAADGKVMSRQALTPSPDLDQPVLPVDGQTSELLTIGATTYAIDSAAATLRWSSQLAGLPTWADGRLYVMTDKGISRLDGETGKPVESFAIPAPPAGSRVYQLGRGFVVGGSSTTVYH